MSILAVLALVLFLCAGILSAIQKSWPIALIAFGLALLTFAPVVGGVVIR